MRKGVMYGISLRKRGGCLIVLRGVIFRMHREREWTSMTHEVLSGKIGLWSRGKGPQTLLLCDKRPADTLKVYAILNG